MDLGYHMPLRFYGPEGSFKRISAVQVLRGGTRPGGAAWQSRHRRRYRHGRVRLVRDAVRSRCARRGSLRDRNRQSLGRRRIGEDAIDPPDRRRPRRLRFPLLMIALMAMRRRGDRARSRKLGLRPLAREESFSPSSTATGSSIAAPLASVVPLTVGFAAARSIVERRAGHKDRRREVDAGQVSLAAPSRPAFERARFSGEAGPPGRRRDVRGSVRVDGRGGGART